MDVKLDSLADDVRRAISRTSEAHEFSVVQDCPSAPAQTCLRIVEIVPKSVTVPPYRKAEYSFNPFNGRLARIVVDYRVSYLDVDAQFTHSFGPPAQSSEKPVAATPFLAGGRELTKIWKDGAIEVALVYTLLGPNPKESAGGHVEFRSVTQVEIMRDLGEKMKELAPKPGTQPAKGNGAETPGGEGKKEEAPPKLF